MPQEGGERRRKQRRRRRCGASAATFQPLPSSSTCSSETLLSAHDVLTAATATVRAWGWRGGPRIDTDALEEALRATATDLPFLAGRLRLHELRLGSAVIEHSGPAGSSPSGSSGGISLVVVDAPDVTVDVMGPDCWGRRGVTIQDPAAPWYVPQMELSLK